MKKHDGGIAFGGSRIEIEEGTGIPRKIEYTGMSLREYYAGQALAGLLANDTGPAGDWKKSAKDALEAADALIAELEGGE
jgi:hypothetical protein